MIPARWLAEQILGWYRNNARTLPWRDDPSPYHVLLSELMCQQTRVETALPYFRRFVERWPTVEALAGASVDEVVREWAGLGYYSRARNLHCCARAIVENGGLPVDAARLRELPGIGAYTAGAIASIAFGRAEPAVDGNVERVLSRVDGRDEDPRSRLGRSALEARARELLVDVAAGDLNQALMELGATVCTPRAPSCARCPWAERCVALAQRRVDELPVKRARARAIPIAAVAGIWRTAAGVLMGKRRQGLLGGLWEPISAPLADETDARDAVRQAFLDRAGVQVRVGALRGTVVHVFSHRRLTLRVFAVEAEGVAEPGPGVGYDEIAWIDPTRPRVALSTLARKTLLV